MLVGFITIASGVGIGIGTHFIFNFSTPWIGIASGIIFGIVCGRLFNRFEQKRVPGMDTSIKPEYDDDKYPPIKRLLAEC